MRTRTLFDIDLTDMYNFNEELVIDYMKTFLNKDKSICRCQNCIEDIYALSLRMIKPRYHPNSLIEKVSTTYLSAQREFSVNAEQDIRKAISAVIANPHHL